MVESRQVVWLGSTLEDLSEMPPPVKREVGFALRAAQEGRKHTDAKPLRGFGGASVQEIVSDYDTNTFRAVYAVRFAGLVYVLHVFQKKSKKGIATPKADLDLIKRRLQEAEANAAQRLAEEGRT